MLIVVDTLRADHLSCYGYGRPTSPAMCALAEDGVLFERAYTTRTLTTPAIASMLTGLYPHRHGVKELYYVLPPAMTTVAERLRARGWATGGFVSVEHALECRGATSSSAGSSTNRRAEYHLQ